jgi:hypothetical protein
MAISVVPLTPSFVAEIGDVNLPRPLSEEDIAAIKNAFWHDAVLIYASPATAGFSDVG